MIAEATVSTVTASPIVERSLAYLRASIKARFGPFPVQIGACSIGSQMPPPTAIRVHVGYHIEHC